MAVNKNLLLPCSVGVIILVTNCDRQCAGHSFDWTPTVAHHYWYEVFLLSLAVKCPQGHEGGCAILVVLQVEVITVTVLRRDGETKGRAVLWRVLVQHSEEGGCLVESYYLNKEVQ